jgi:pimeloyl-ACP methyl ester carboxylesterase
MSFIGTRLIPAVGWMLIAMSTGPASCPDFAAAQPRSGLSPSDSLSVEPYTLRTYDGVEHPAEMLGFRVPEDRSRPSGRALQLRCVRLRSTSSHPRSPIVFLSGGPGIPATGMAQVPVYYELFERLRGVADVLLLDQRGMGASALSIQSITVPISPDAFTSSARLLEAMQQSLAASAEAHRRAGCEVAAYTTEANAEDIDDLRRAVGAEHLNLLGFSYGTSLALLYAQRHPGCVHRMALAGVQGPDRLLELASDWDSKLEKLTALAARDTALGPRYSNLDSLFEAAANRLRSHVLTLLIADPASGDTITIRLGEPGLLYVLRNRMNDRAIPLLPTLLRGFADGDVSLIAGSCAQAYGSLRAGLSATDFALSISRGWTRPRRLEAAADSAHSRMNLVNLQWSPQVRDLLGLGATPEFVTPVRSDVPTLLVSGTLDSNTPLRDAEELAKGFSNGILVPVENGGHETLPVTEVQDLVLAFFGERELPFRRVSLPAPAFLAPTEAAKRLKLHTPR